MPMPRGFPRPMKKVAKINPTHRVNRMLSDYSAWNDKLYPVPYSAKVNDIGDTCKARVLECVKKRMCQVCGLKVEGNPWAYVLHSRFQHDSGPFHEKCAKLTLAKCPVVHINTEFVFFETTWSILESGGVYTPNVKRSSS